MLNKETHFRVHRITVIIYMSPIPALNYSNCSGQELW